MPFPENIKLEAKRKSDFQCCICKEPFVEVHHITPQAAGGSDDIDNAAPFCASCHDRYGGNPDKRKQVREMRDLWWEVCAERKKAPELIAFNQRLDQIQSGIAQTHIAQVDYGAALNDLKSAFLTYAKHSAASVSSSGSFEAFQAASGIALPKELSGFSFSGRCPQCGSTNTKLLGPTDGYLGEVRECQDCHQQFHRSHTY
jgi:hypothetical protein